LVAIHITQAHASTQILWLTVCLPISDIVLGVRLGILRAQGKRAQGNAVVCQLQDAKKDSSTKKQGLLGKEMKDENEGSKGSEEENKIDDDDDDDDGGDGGGGDEKRSNTSNSGTKKKRRKRLC
jgi:hypothetical protein